MSRYIVEFKQEDQDGYIHTKKTYVDAAQAVSAAWTAMEKKGDFEYLIVRRLKDKPVVVKPTKPQESK